MQLDHDSAVAGTALSFVIAWTALCGWVFNVRAIAISAREGVRDIRAERADLKVERDQEKREFDERLKAAEQTAGAVRELAEAVRHGAEMTNATIKNLADRFSEHAADTKEQLGEVKEEQRNVRLALARRQSPARKAAK